MGEFVSRRLRRPRPLLRAAVELVNALNGVRPLGRTRLQDARGVLVRVADLRGAHAVPDGVGAGRRAPRPPRRLRRIARQGGAGPDSRRVGGAGGHLSPQRDHAGAGAQRGAARRPRRRLRRRDRNAAVNPLPDRPAQRRAAHHPDTPALRRQGRHRALRPVRPGEPGRHLAHAAICPATAKHLCWCRFRAAPGSSVCVVRRPTH